MDAIYGSVPTQRVVGVLALLQTRRFKTTYDRARTILFLYVVIKYGIKYLRHVRARGTLETCREGWSWLSERTSTLLLTLPPMAAKFGLRGVDGVYIKAIYHTSRSGLVDLKQLRWGVVESALGPNAGLRPGRHTLWLLVLLRAGGFPIWHFGETMRYYWVGYWWKWKRPRGRNAKPEGQRDGRTAKQKRRRFALWQM